MTTLWRDIRYSSRLLWHSPGFAAVVVLTLALGIGTNTAVFSFLDRVLLRPLPVERPNELVAVEFQTERGDRDDSFNYPLYTAYRDRSEVFAGLIAYGGDVAQVDIGGTRHEVLAMAVSGDYFSVLGVTPILGRGFGPEEEQPAGAHPVAVLSYQFWQQRYQGDPAVVGQTLNLYDRPLTIVGVAPPTFTGTIVGVGPAVYVPLGAWADVKGFTLDERGYTWLHLLGRLRPGCNRDQAQANLRVLAAQIQTVEPLNVHTNILISDGSQGYNLWRHEGFWWPLALLQIPTALVLVVACANVTNLLLARGTTRQKEIAVRRALGARRGDVIRLLLCESLLLGFLSAVGGVLLAHWLSHGLRHILTISRMLNTPVGIDGRVFVFALLVSLSSVVLFGLIPALQVTRSRALPASKEGTGIITAPIRWCNLRNLSVVMQVAVSMIVVAFGTLCIRSLGKLRVADPGFDPSGVIGVSVDFDQDAARGLEPQPRFEMLQRRVSAFPGVEAVSLATRMPLASTGRNKTGIKHIDQFEMPPDQEWLSIDYDVISPGYFQTLGVPLLRGRDFTTQDDRQSRRVMIVNNTFALRYWPGQDPIGKHVTFADVTREVVGVAEAAKLNSIREELVPMIFWPMAQPMTGRYAGTIKPVMLIGAAGDPAALIQLVRREIESTGLGPVACDVRTLSDRAADLLSAQSTIATILNTIGLVGLLFVGTGICGVVAYEVSRRTREIGIRIALGARRADVTAWVLRRGAILTGVGLALGIGASLVPMWLLSRLLPEIRTWDAYFLYGVPIWDPLTYAGAALLLTIAALGACWLPARRAAKIDPMVALRHE